MEKKAEAIYKLLSDYQTEFRTQFVLAAFLPFVAAWASLVTKAAEKKGDYADVAFVIILASLLVVLIMIIGYLRHEKNRGFREKAWLIVMRANGRQTELVRFYDHTPLSAFPLAEGARSHWAIRVDTNTGSPDYLVDDALEMTIIQANALLKIMSEKPNCQCQCQGYAPPWPIVNDRPLISHADERA